LAWWRKAEVTDDETFLVVTVVPIVLFVSAVCVYDWLAQRQQRRQREHHKSA